MKAGFEAARPTDWDDVREARVELLQASRLLETK
jgi:hypothetical protein